MKKSIIFLLLFPLVLCAQDIKYAHNVIDSLGSPALNGRGYTYNADKLASEFIANELKSFKIPPFGISYYQEFLLNTNVFPNQMSVIINKLKLKAGVDYIIDARSNSIDGTFKIVTLNKKIISNESQFKRFKSKNYSNEFIFVDTTGLNDKSFAKEYKNIVNSNSLKARGIICLSNKLTYIPARKQEKFVRIIVKDSAIPGEELGLLGSKYYVDHPLFPLEKIKFLVNIDMMGSGDDGIQIVNSSVFVDEYNLMLELNKKNDLLPNVKKRGPAANSDHYFFYAKGVPSYFIYSLGDYKQYHNIYDSRENIPLSGYNQMFKLFKLFVLNL